MKHPRLQFLALVVGLVAVGAVAGRIAAPALARGDYVVQAAERVWLEESTGIEDEEQTLQSTAVRIQGVPLQMLFGDAAAVRAKFRVGATLFGAWCGLVAALKIASVLAQRRRRDYVTDPAHCLSCARCFLSCPVEHQRREGRTI